MVSSEFLQLLADFILQPSRKEEHEKHRAELKERLRQDATKNGDFTNQPFVDLFLLVLWIDPAIVIWPIKQAKLLFTLTNT